MGRKRGRPIKAFPPQFLTPADPQQSSTRFNNQCWTLDLKIPQQDFFKGIDSTRHSIMLNLPRSSLRSGGPWPSSSTSEKQLFHPESSPRASEFQSNIAEIKHVKQSNVGPMRVENHNTPPFSTVTLAQVLLVALGIVPALPAVRQAKGHGGVTGVECWAVNQLAEHGRRKTLQGWPTKKHLGKHEKSWEKWIKMAKTIQKTIQKLRNLGFFGKIKYLAQQCSASMPRCRCKRRHPSPNPECRYARRYYQSRPSCKQPGQQLLETRKSVTLSKPIRWVKY